VRRAYSTAWSASITYRGATRVIDPSSAIRWRGIQLWECFFYQRRRCRADHFSIIRLRRTVGLWHCSDHGRPSRSLFPLYRSGRMKNLLAICRLQVQCIFRDIWTQCRGPHNNNKNSNSRCRLWGTWTDFTFDFPAKLR